MKMAPVHRVVTESDERLLAFLSSPSRVREAIRLHWLNVVGPSIQRGEKLTHPETQKD
jgi:hypothetical protein